MLETFDWTDVMVLNRPHAQVFAIINPDYDALAAIDAPGATFGFVVDGQNAVLRHGGRPHAIPAGMYFVCDPLECELCTPGGRILLIHQPGANFPFMVGGPIEPVGRLRYIDGCTDSLLIPPWRKGEACLNHLHIPAGTEQTMHTHPSDRIGVVVSGSGWCETPEGETALTPGTLWRIPAEGLHRFRTTTSALNVVAWHPDSDFGPTDDSHPMIQRTIVNGVSAAHIPDIRTR